MRVLWMVLTLEYHLFSHAIHLIALELTVVVLAPFVHLVIVLRRLFRGVSLILLLNLLVCLFLDGACHTVALWRF